MFSLGIIFFSLSQYLFPPASQVLQLLHFFFGAGCVLAPGMVWLCYSEFGMSGPNMLTTVYRAAAVLSVLVGLMFVGVLVLSGRRRGVGGGGSSPGTGSMLEEGLLSEQAAERRSVPPREQNFDLLHADRGGLSVGNGANGHLPVTTTLAGIQKDGDPPTTSGSKSGEPIPEGPENHEAVDALLEDPSDLLRTVLLFSFLFFYVGLETGYGSWICAYGQLGPLQLSPADGASLSAVYWTGFVLGRLGGVLLAGICRWQSEALLSAFLRLALGACVGLLGCSWAISGRTAAGALPYSGLAKKTKFAVLGGVVRPSSEVLVFGLLTAEPTMSEQRVQRSLFVRFFPESFHLSPIFHHVLLSHTWFCPLEDDLCHALTDISRERFLQRVYVKTCSKAQ